MAEKPILFSGPMVRAILEGRKDVARMLMNPQPPVDAETCHHNSYSGPEGPAWWWFKGTGDGERLCCWPKPGKVVEPRYRKGDVLYVTEAWRTISDWDDRKPSELPTNAPILYEAIEGGPLADVWGRYRNARYMCKWMSRLWLRVPGEPTPERVRDITRAEAIREIGPDLPNNDPVWCFKQAWAGLHGPDSWERDWVWRIAIERTEAPHG